MTLNYLAQRLLFELFDGDVCNQPSLHFKYWFVFFLTCNVDYEHIMATAWLS